MKSSIPIPPLPDGVVLELRDCDVSENEQLLSQINDKLGTRAAAVFEAMIQYTTGGELLEGEGSAKLNELIRASGLGCSQREMVDLISQLAGVTVKYRSEYVLLFSGTIELA